MKLTYEQWRKQVDEELLKLSGLDGDDLPDWDYRLGYQEEMSPRAAARKVIAAARNF